MDQLIFASLSHTHFWYEVGMLKVLAVCMYVNILYVCMYVWKVSELDETHTGEVVMY